MSTEPVQRVTLRSKSPSVTPINKANQDPTQTESEVVLGHVECDFFVFPTDKIQGFYWIEAVEDEETQTEATTVVHLEGWVCPINRPDPQKKLYYFLRKILQPTKRDL